MENEHPQHATKQDLEELRTYFDQTIQELRNEIGRLDAARNVRFDGHAPSGEPSSPEWQALAIAMRAFQKKWGLPPVF